MITRYHTKSIEITGVGSDGESRPWDVSLQEQQECVCISRSGSGVAGVSGGGGSGNRFGRVVLGEF